LRRFDNLEQTRTYLLEFESAMHRGPFIIDGGRRICQLIDPFGKTFGLDGL
jgi:predicted enzyme related to lactoylglutathione lyase